MGNMSHCRFENTLSDLQDCQSALQENGSIKATIEDVNQYEKRCVKALVELCRDIFEEFGDEENEEEE